MPIQSPADTSRARSAGGMALWFPAAERQPVEDFFLTYEANQRHIHASAVDWSSRPSQVDPSRAISAENVSWGQRQSREILLGVAAAVRDPTELAAALPIQMLEELGRVYARDGLSLRGARQAAGAFQRFLVPLLVERFGEQPQRLIAALHAASDFVDQATGILENAFAAQLSAESRAQAEDLATTLDSIGDAVVVTDAAGRVVRLNPVAEHLLGIPIEECRGTLLDEIFHIQNEDTGETVENPVTRVLRDGLLVGLANHTELVARDGTRRPIADSGAPVRGEDGQIRGVVLVFRDVTAERAAEAELRHWQRIFQHATWGVAVASADEVKFQAVNPAYAAMHGYTVDELLGAPVSTLWAPETKADMERHAKETHHHGRLVVETMHRCKDGTLIPVEVVATTLKDSSGKVRSFVANVQDITERRRLQQSRVRAIELEAENRRIEEANRLKSEFLANMSHELRTPLNSIIGFAELVHDEHVGSINPKQKEFLDEILVGGRHLLRLINEVLDLAKVEAGKMDFRPEPAELQALAGGVVQSLRPTARAKGLQVEIIVDPRLDDIVIDPGRFKQVLYNYVSNAVKFTPDGGHVTVRITPESEDLFRVEVEDDGTGIDAEDAEHLFTAFRQLDSSTGKKHQGTGLGLALTKRLAEAQGGTVGMRPAPEHGSVFFAILPRRPPSQAKRPASGSSPPQRAAVLVVERDTEHRIVVERILRDSGYLVDSVATCAKAIAAWPKRVYDAVTLDMLEGEPDQLQELLSIIRRDARGPRIPIIAVALVTDRGAVAGFAVSDVLTKPVDAAALLASLERGGAVATRGKPVMVVDDDSGSLKLMEATLGKLGYDALCFSDSRAALDAVAEATPLAIILDLIMPDLDGLAFLEQLRAAPASRHIPVMVWTVKDLSVDERQRLRASAIAVVQKGVDSTGRLSEMLQQFFLGEPQMEHNE